MRYTPENITKLGVDEIFVFGSNESGFHGAGGARYAYDYFEARYGMGFGMMSHSFALPTKDWEIKTLPLPMISFYVNRFVAFAKLHPELTFLVTKIGMGLAGLTLQEVAPLFEQAKNLSNIILPREFWEVINQKS
jgi:hypothetical protein